MTPTGSPSEHTGVGEAGGLSGAEAATRLERDGPNILPVPPPTPAWRQFAGELFHFFALLFWVAGALAFLAGLPQLGFAVFIVILLNASFAFVQQQRMSVVAGGSVLVKGAPDAVIPRCVVPPGATDALEGLAARGLRVLAVAARAVGASAPDWPTPRSGISSCSGSSRWRTRRAKVLRSRSPSVVGPG